MRSLILLFILIPNILQKRVYGSNADYEDDREASTLQESNGGNDYKEFFTDFVGTNLFDTKAENKKCFSSEEVALLTSRKEFECIIPKQIENCLVDDEFVEILMQYFYGANQILLRITTDDERRFAQKAFYDTLGGYLNYYLLPVTKMSFYTGVISLKTAQNVNELFRQCKNFLNTNGNGWRTPITDFTDFDLDIEPLSVFMKPYNSEMDASSQTACINLNLADEKSENDEDMIVSLPKLDTEESGELSNIWLPFRRKHSFNLRSSLSAFILIRYFVAVSKCYHFQDVSQDTFNRRFRDWFHENIEVHLTDDVVYPGLGAVLRIIETIRLKKKFVIYIDERQSGTSRKDSRKSQEFIKIKNKADKLPDTRNFFEKLFSTRKESEDNSNLDDYADGEEESPDEKRNKYIFWTVIITVSLLIFVIIVALITKYGKSSCKKKSKYNSRDYSKKESFCSRLTKSCRKKRNQINKEDEEFQLDGDSPAILPQKLAKEYSKKSLKSKRSIEIEQAEIKSLSSSSKEQISPVQRKTTKCLPLCLRGSKTRQNISSSNKIPRLINRNALNSVARNSLNRSEDSARDGNTTFSDATTPRRNIGAMPKRLDLSSSVNEKSESTRKVLQTGTPKKVNKPTLEKGKTSNSISLPSGGGIKPDDLKDDEMGKVLSTSWETIDTKR